MISPIFNEIPAENTDHILNSKKFPALLLDESLPNGRLSGEVYVDAGKVIFHHPDLERSINLSVAEIQHGGTGNRHIYFKSANIDFTICALDASILKEEGLKATRTLHAGVSKIKRKHSVIKTGILLAVILVVGILASFIIFRNQIVHSIANQVPESLEIKLGSMYMKQLTLTEKLDSTSEAVFQLRAKAKLIQAQTHSDITFTVYISNSEQVNAYALPGGFVVFNKGLLEKATSWEEVLGVMGHEMAHVTQKHHARGVLSKIGWVTVANIFLGDGSAITDLLLTTSSQLEQLSYSRGFETEADEKGFEYLTDANINPSGLITFFGTLKKESGVANHIPELLSTHPASDNRIEHLQKKLDKETNKTFVDLGNYNDFKKLITKSK